MKTPNHHRLRWENGYAGCEGCGPILSIEIELMPDLYNHEAVELIRTLTSLMGFVPEDESDTERKRSARREVEGE